MKAIIQNDIIINITARGNTEIGSLPKGVGRERLRFDGQKVVDLADLNEIWVKPIGPGFYELHAIEVSGSQKVIMTYADRKNLVMENGIIRVQAPAEVQAEALAEQEIILKNQYRKVLEKDIGDPQDNIADLYKFITLLIDYILTGDKGIEDLLNNLILVLRAAYPMDGQSQLDLIDRIITLKDHMVKYYMDKDKLKKREI